jgi:hypothetical protein
MADRESDEIFCSWEMMAFPKEQFVRHPEYGMVHEHPPGDTPKHTTSGKMLPTEEGAVKYWSIPSSGAASSS